MQVASKVPPSKQRQLFFQLLTCVMIAFTVLLSWGIVPFGDKRDSDEPTPLAVTKETLQEDIFLAQSRIIVGALTLLGTQQGAGTDNSHLILDVFRNTSITINEEIEKQNPSTAQLLRKRLIMAEYFNFKADSERLFTKLNEMTKNTPPKSSEEQAMDAVVKVLASHQTTALSEEQRKLLQDKLGWFGEIAIYLLETDLTTKASLKTTFSEVAENMMYRFIILVVVISFIVITGLITLFYLSFNFITGRFKSKLPIATFPHHYLLEIFALYLLCMLLGTFVITNMAQSKKTFDPLLANITLIFGLVVLVFWPLFWKIRFKELMLTTGLFTKGLRRLLADIFYSPFVYSACAICLFFVMFFYALVLSAFDIDLSRGTHPIVPILQNTEDVSRLILIGLLAVVVAPLIEEIMFRGVLYSYFRARLNIFFAALISAFIFAAVHPQGALGLVPLTTIGFCLALIREWRGSIAMPVVVHGCVNGVTLMLVLLLFR